jgi:hypothetical protein
MPSNNTFYRDASSVLFFLLAAFGCFAFAVWMIYLSFVPEAEPAIWRELDAWSNSHPRDVQAIGVMLLVGGLAWAMTSLHTETQNKLSALETQLNSIAEDLADLKSDLRDLDSKI